MKIASTLGLVILYFLVAVGAVSTIEFAFTLMNKADTLSFIGGLGLFIITGAFIILLVMHIINEYKEAKEFTNKNKN
jgi:amino acid transporter